MMSSCNSKQVIPLEGNWDFSLDPERKGWAEKWYQKDLPLKVTLPGITDEFGVGDVVTKRTLENLSRKYEYMGQAWYKRTVSVDEDLSQKRCYLFLERCLWETHLWVDDTYIGTQNSLVSPHIYDLSGHMKTGIHTLTLLVDNSNQYNQQTDEEVEKSKRRDLTSEVNKNNKLNCGGHHTHFLMNTYWNGIIGKIQLHFTNAVFMEEINVFSDINANKLKIRTEIVNEISDSLNGIIHITVSEQGTSEPCMVWHSSKFLINSGHVQETFETAIPKNPKLWDEFEPKLYEIRVELMVMANEKEKFFSTAETTFGIRELSSRGQQLLCNGKPIFLRGTLENCTFPLSFHPPMDVEPWQQIFRTAKSYGLNHIRFHSWCPPDAAFTAADNIGMLLQVELPGTSCPSSEEDANVSEYLQAELERILKFYGNHPSFCFVSMGNEQLIATENMEFLKKHQELLMTRVKYGQKKDPRHFYTCTSHPYTDGRNDDYYVTAWSKKGWEKRSILYVNEFQYHTDWDGFVTGIRWGGSDPLYTSIFCVLPPSTLEDYRGGIEGIERPIITHEVGQWSVFPNVMEINKYVGVLRPDNLEIIRNSLAEKGMLEKVEEFVQASGKLSLLLYKEEIERVMRTPGLSGFQLLDIFDYPGQGTSTVGILDSMWNSKGLTTPKEYRHFCSETVPLLRMKKRVWTSNEIFCAQVEVSHYGPSDMEVTPLWQVSGANGKVHMEGQLENIFIPSGGLSSLGDIKFNLSSFNEAQKLKITVALKNTKVINSWDVWIYPGQLSEPKKQSFSVTHQWDNAAKAELKNGRNVLLMVSSDILCESLPGVFTTAFWNPIMKPQTGTMGLLCDEKHPMFQYFPTDFHTDWQWWDILQYSRIMILDFLPTGSYPVVQMIDSFVNNRKLGILFECRVGNGRLVICSADLEKNIENRLAARQLKHSIMNYMESASFQPITTVDVEKLDELFNTAISEM